MVAGLVLTGGASRRFGVDKATLLVDGERLVDRTERLLGAVADPVLEVGPGHGRAPATREAPPGSGPLASVAAGAAALDEMGVRSRWVVVLAVDLPRLDVALLEWLARHPADASVVPLVEGRSQPLCARYDVAALATARDLVAQGERAMTALLAAVSVHAAAEDEWGGVVDASAFADVDTREDAAALGVELPSSR